jgi:hypothetical protein
MHLCSIGGSVLAWEVDLYLVLNSGPVTSRMVSQSTSHGPLISAAFTALFLQPAPVYCESKHRTALYTQCTHRMIKKEIQIKSQKRIRNVQSSIRLTLFYDFLFAVWRQISAWCINFCRYYFLKVRKKHMVKKRNHNISSCLYK